MFFRNHLKTINSSKELRFHYSDFILIKNQFASYSQANTLGQIGTDDITINRIRKAIINFINDLPEQFWQLNEDELEESRIEENVMRIVQISQIQNDLMQGFAVVEPTFEEIEKINSYLECENDIPVLSKKLLGQYFDLSQLELLSFDSSKYYLIAKRLFNDIENERIEVFSKKQFVYPIHKYLSYFIRNSAKKIRFIEILNKWLCNELIHTTARNFAAFELGMIKAKVALPSLLQRVEIENEDYHVKYYSIMSIAMIKDKSSTQPLIKIFELEKNVELKNVIANVINYIHNY